MTTSRPIRWLHLSDLHMGCKGRAVWEQVESSFLQDLDAHLDHHGPPDLLLFTGDLAYSGQAKEYDDVDRLLDAIAERLQCSGSPEPILLPVPGNHDVMRPSTRADRLAFRILRDFDGTIDDPEVAEIYKELWQDEDASFLSPLFEDYIRWFDRRVRPHLEEHCEDVHFSHFPGDYLAKVHPEGAFPLAVLGLNSTWLQYTGGVFDSKLLIPIEQYRAAVAPADRNPEEVFEHNEHTLLLMHQPPSWLCRKGREIFDGNIYRPDVITACLFGHMHRANGTEFRSAGGKPRVFLQSPSLFGMEKYGTSKEDRAFGYSWGQLNQDGEICIWPRELARKRDGVWSFGADPSFHYEADDAVVLRTGIHSTKEVAVAQRGIDLKAYLDHVIEQTSTLEIRGIVKDRNQSALRPAIENLYTPLRRRGFGRATVEAPDGSEVERGDGTEVLQAVLKESKRVLIEGDPGAGKTTFLRFVACMLARDAAGYRCPGKRSWRHEYLDLDTGEPAVPVILRLSALALLLVKDSDTQKDDRFRLLDALQAELDSAGLPELLDRDYWKQLFEDNRDDKSKEDKGDKEVKKDGKVWLLLDGLDEVDDLDLRERLFRIVNDAVSHWTQTPIMVASRPFNTKAMVKMQFRVTVVEPLRQADISTFLAHWVSALHQQDADRARLGEARRYRESLKTAILNRSKIRALARNPVMLTCLCIVHWNQGDLPEVRSRVYQAVIHWLLNARTEQRRAKFELEPDFAERTLATLALHGMRTTQGKQSLLAIDDAVSIIQPAFERQLPDATSEARRQIATRWLLFECEGSGVVEELAGQRLRFWHLTFQEFLAALELARMERKDWWPILEQQLEKATWRETSELFTTCLYDSRSVDSLDQLLQAILARGLSGTDLAAEARTVGTLGRLLVPLKHCRYQLRSDLQTAYDAALERSMAIFTVEGAAKVNVETRIAAAEALGQGGDPRLRPETLEANLLTVPGQTWRLCKYPVTVEEYQRFVDARGYEDPHLWGEGWSVNIEKGWEGPGSWEQQLETPNRPVVEVSWWEAIAYCAWLSELRGKAFRLPRQEEEWELAATHPAGQYPWGEDEPDEDRCNFGRNVNRPSPVGIYPRGDGPQGHCDLGGNVWEWCVDSRNARKSRPLRGGGWNSPADYIRSFRNRDKPGSRYSYLGFRVLCAPEPDP